MQSTTMRSSLFIIITLLLSACSVMTWHDVPPRRTLSAVANDRGGTAFIMQGYQQNSRARDNPGDLLAGRRNYRYQVWVEENNSPPRAVSGDINGRAEALHYMRSAAYILLQHRPNDRGKPAEYRQLILQTGAQRVAAVQRGRQGTALCGTNGSPSFIVENVLPSPDGRWLAHVYSDTCAKAKVLFIDAQSAVIRGQHEVNVVNVNQAAWRTDGYLAVTSLFRQDPNNREVWLLRPGAAPIRP